MLGFFRRKKGNLSSAGEKIRAHVFVSGKVQGVFFRESTKHRAEKLGVSGWVKNLKDGRVEAVFDGEKGNVEKMVNWARKGPIWAKIEALDVVWEDYRAEFKGFEIRYDL
jgi:acylphosphatase